MKHLLIKALASSGLMLLTLTANAQYQPRVDQYQREARHDHIFDRARGDLDRAGEFALPFTGDRDRLAVAEARVNECQQAVAASEENPRTFGDTIASIQRVVDRNHLPDRTRDLLAEDIAGLRDLQARLEG
jgi:hypothetical protein